MYSSRGGKLARPYQIQGGAVRVAFANSYPPLIPVLEIDRADQGQLETASERVNGHYEVGAAARRRKPARASDKGEDPVITTHDWVE